MGKLIPELRESEKPETQRSLRILIIEDVDADVELTLLALESAGLDFTYDIASTAIECQEHLQDEIYDVVLSDYRLPSFNGLQAFNFLKQSGQDIPFILITGSLGEEAAVECIKAGMTDYVLKDRLFRLPSVLQRALQEFALRQQQKNAIAQIEQQAWRETIINRIVQAMRETLVLEDVLQTTADLLQEALHVSHCLIFQPDTLKRMRVCYASKNNVDHSESVIGLSCGFYEHYHDDLVQGKQISIHPIGDSLPEGLRQLGEKYSIYSLLITSLVYQQTYLGGISLYQCDRERIWSEDELSLVKAIADQCAIAIHQSDLYQNAQSQLMERKKMEAQLRHDAFHDALTGLPNRALFSDRLSHALQLSQRRSHLNAGNLSEKFAVLFLDLDRFKVINDSLGHLAGDQLLKVVADRLTACLRGGDTVARLGGDEFVMLIEEIQDVNDVIDVVQRIQGALKVPILIDGNEIFVTASIGIAFNSADHNNPEQLLRDADLAMYRAKDLGRERYETFNPDMHTEALRKLRLESELRRAIDRQELRVHYQPIVCLKTRQILGFEALVRWQHPEQGLVSPAEFIPIAEDIGLIGAIDFWVLQEACSQLRAWQDQFPMAKALTMNVNLSGRQFAKPDLTSQIEKVLSRTNLNHASLKIEVTESILIEKTSLSTKILSELQEQNIQICIDDFGTGYSSLSYLHRFPIHTLKIDQSFVSRIDSNSKDGEIVKAIIILGINLGLNVVAEGVETAEQLCFLEANNCHAGQGYYLFKPLEADTITKLLGDMPDRRK
ncbi:diguanylate cyclase/phosphodiesterasewith PAS/PAC sensor [Pseudanabaena sp. lw0831]|uniref:EAL domain-containing protein n=1 Tax=Pseudanabaena sp. lw0831 TaxID=1357935 RepID=UPI0019160233|nr:EAL domain-containing protein [Pseudanabaena sp. lw0831]GBO55779.1 diguanylate cyclase/phosphodiesterasewith PAS/PAC sensor [Pseudanabaena sp. lw0831]